MNSREELDDIYIYIYIYIYIISSAQIIDQFGDPIHPLFSCFEELIFKVPGKEGFLNSPLLHIQGSS